MKKTFMGVRLRSLREERGMSQAALAQQLGLSPSYLNQIEQNQRPLTVPVLLRLHATLGVDIQAFSEDEEARLLAGLREALADNPGGEPVALAELREVATQMPAVGRALVALHQRHRDATERLEALAAQLGDGRGDLARLPQARPMPFEEVRDFFFAHQNHIAPLDDAAEAFSAQWKLREGSPGDRLAQRLLDAHGVRVVPADDDDAGGAQRRYDPATRVLRLSRYLEPGQHAFQLATQLAFLEAGGTIDRLVAAAPLSSDTARSLARIGLANYFAAALLLPYGLFLAAAEQLRYDIDQLARRFGVGFETICHRLSSLQRPQARGVPFFLVRVDRAGNISKRQSATHFHFSKTGGTCPLWNVYEAFGQPGRVLTQLARMPDGRAYLWIARTVSHGFRGYGSPNKTFSIGLGCDISHATRLVYSKGLDLRDPEVPTPIGAGCKVCEREACPQRAFPFVGRPLEVDENLSRFMPYAAAPERTAAALRNAARRAPASVSPPRRSP
ncbi:putative transcriptional regulator/transcriptional regulator with XRE-family HTH domain [Variovorax sp. TBS-050B]|uniref:short-chain fatty acyl-CoA regulator family protein n=1 Tax=Variovorax sp. TBS-050B TaxID=2940551 RepID=UPI002476F78B|nr:short-chain fatty acyl-CoA regulator family protein [Variovorax sp. TBS-050B]MDH6593979.1 putative transcriptional regulator/transcriptional regulator with XRE-family HTH domain [Variovorax sp. TBS-050B]